MSDILVTSPYRPFTLPNQFKAVFNGFIYCGTVDAVDPSNSQVQVYFVNEDGSRTAASQPLRTNAGGFLVYNGQPAKFVTDSNHSLLVRDLLGNTLWYAPNMANIDPETALKSLGVIVKTANSVSEMKSMNPANGDKFRTLGYYSASDGGGANYKITDTFTGTPDGFGDHALQNGLFAVLDTSSTPSVMQYGAKAGIPYNNKPAIQAAVNAANSRYVVKGAVQYVYSPEVKFEMGSASDSPRISMLSGVALLSDGTKFKTANNAPRDSNWNAVFLFGGLDSRIPCVTSGIKGLVFIDGNRQNNNPGALDEKHSGIYISRDAYDIFFDDVVIEDAAGDGLLVQQLGFPYDREAVPKNIRFRSLICRRSWRNGVSLVDYDGVHIDYLESTDTNGIAPQSGLDIEPNYWEARARNLWIGHYVSKGNRGSGLDVLQHNNNSEQRAGTIGRFDSDGDGEIMRLFTCCGLSILDGVGKNATSTYCMEIAAAKDLRVKMDFLNNKGGVLGDITKGWVSEPDVNGGTHVVMYPSEGWDFSGSTFRNNGGTQLSMKGVVSTDPVSGVPRTFKLKKPNIDWCIFDNGLPEGDQQSSIHLNIQSDVEMYSARNVSISSDAPNPYYVNRASSTGRIDSGSTNEVYSSLSYPAIPANGYTTVQMKASSDLGSYDELIIRSAQDLGPLIVSGYIGSGGAINLRLINPTTSIIQSGNSDFILTSSFTK